MIQVKKKSGKIKIINKDGGRDLMTNLWSDLVHYRFLVRKIEENDFGSPKKITKLTEFRANLVFPVTNLGNNYIFVVRKDGVFCK
jgi:hypothetical protein